MNNQESLILPSVNFNSKILDRDKIDICMYHGNCSDGFGSAFIVWYYFKEKFKNDILYVPCYYSTPLKDSESIESYPKFSSEFLEKYKNKNILMCDFSYKFGQLVDLINVSSSFMILDHHKTSKEALEQLPDSLKIFDNNKSGVGLTWEYFFGNLNLPLFLQHIQYRDLGKNFNEHLLTTLDILPKNNEFIAFFYNQGFDFQVWEKYLDPKNVENSIIIGGHWLQHTELLVKKIVKQSDCFFHKYHSKEGTDEIICGAYANSRILQSEIGNKLIIHHWFSDFGAVVGIDHKRDETHFSLRSSNERLDVSEFAKIFSGGGHRNASGMSKKGIDIFTLEKIDDHGLLKILENRILHPREEISQFIVKGVKQEWNQFIPFILKKTKNFVFTEILFVDGEKKFMYIIYLSEREDNRLQTRIDSKSFAEIDFLKINNDSKI